MRLLLGAIRLFVYRVLWYWLVSVQQVAPWSGHLDRQMRTFGALPVYYSPKAGNGLSLCYRRL